MNRYDLAKDEEWVKELRRRQCPLMSMSDALKLFPGSDELKTEINKRTELKGRWLGRCICPSCRMK
jgi:hypothetical protein